MIDITIVIVNYNVRHFILQCLQSIFNSNLEGLTLEVIVVDNASVDGSVAAIKDKFPQVYLIANADNKGFGKANNQAILKAKGQYTLLLNPDTILEEGTLMECIDFMKNHHEYAALGVKMVDGRGAYLPESKRSLPTPLGALFKLSGISSIFPQSRYFNSYYTSDLSGNIDEDVEVLCGAFMFCKTSILQSLGGFDEAFFMYGEDIDLSKRILEADHKIKYLSSSRIIHFKGESSKKSNLNYLHSFYNAMIIYVDKHYEGNSALITKSVLKLGIFTAGISKSIKLWSKKLIRPIIDFLIIYLGIGLIKNLWSQYYFGDINYYQDSDFHVNQIFYSVVWSMALWFWGWYDHQRKWKSLSIGAITGALGILVAYALFPMEYRSSRVIIILSGLYLLVSMGLFDMLVGKLKALFLGNSKSQKTILIVANIEEADQIKSQISEHQKNVEFVGVINPNPEDFSPDYVNDINAISDVIQIYDVQEIVLSAHSMTSQQMMNIMTIPMQNLRFKIAHHTQIISSSGNQENAEIIDAFSKYNLSKNVYRRLKRLLDILITVSVLVLFPLAIFNQKLGHILRNSIQILLGKTTLITYQLSQPYEQMPRLKKGVFMLQAKSMPKDYNIVFDGNINAWYAQNYTPFYDLEILKKLLP